jgi:hypothetical protein
VSIGTVNKATASFNTWPNRQADKLTLKLVKTVSNAIKENLIKAEKKDKLKKFHRKKLKT